MTNGRYGDNPISDLLVHKAHPLPCDVEAMIKKLYAIDPELLNDFGIEPFEWTKRKNLEQGRDKLRSLLMDQGHNPHAIALMARLLHSFYLVGGLLLISTASLVLHFIYRNSPFFDIGILKWAVPLGPMIVGIALLARWIKNR